MKSENTTLLKRPFCIALILFLALVFGLNSQALAGVDLEVPLEMASLGLKSGTAGRNFYRTRMYLDTNDYDNATYYFEIVARNSNITYDYSVILKDENVTTMATIIVDADTPIAVRKRSPAFTPTTGKNIYYIKLVGTEANAQLKVYTARIIVQQTNATKTRIQIPLVGDGYNTCGVKNDAVDTTTSITYTQGVPKLYSIWKKDSSAWGDIASVNPWTVEAVLSGSATGTAYAALYNTNGSAVTGAEVSYMGEDYFLAEANFINGAANFTDGDTFEFKIKASSGTTAQLRSGGRLYVRLTNLSKGEVYWRFARKNGEIPIDYVYFEYQRVLLNTNNYSNPEVYHESTGYESVSGDLIAYVADAGTGDSGPSASYMTNSSIEFDSTARARQRTTTDLMPDVISGNNYISSIYGTSGTIVVVSGWLVVKFSAGAACPTPGTPGSPSPADAATDQSIDVDLDWSDCTDTDTYDVYFGTSASPPLYEPDVAISSYTLPTLEYCTQYYWKIVAKNACGESTPGPVWDFTTVSLPSPGAPSTPSPADGATGVLVDADLDWADSSDTTSYDVYFGTSASPPLYESDVAISSYALPTLEYCTQYYWKIVAKNACDTTAGPVWDFTTETLPSPGTPSTPNPADGATGISIDADLDWADCSNATSYDVYFGTSPTPPYYGNTASSNYTLPTHGYETQYYWKVIAKNNCDNTEGPVWDFTTELCPTPGTPSSPNPADGATGVSVDADLDWADCSDADSYDVYGGTSPTPGYLGNTSSSSWPLGTLLYETTYYWKIIAKNDCGNSTEGPVWDFTTEPCPIPGTPSGPSPGIGATGVSVSAVLDWADCSDTDTYEVYLDTNPTPTTKVGESSSSTYDPDLNWDTHYYWKIIAKNDCGNSTEGPVWDFTTGPDPGGDHLVWPSSPTPLSPYSDWDTAAHTIADAVTAAVASPKLGTKTVLVRAGTSYSERVFMRDEVDVIAEAGVKPFIAAAGGTFTGVVEFNQPITCTVRGFTIQNNSSMGSAVHVDGSGGQVNATIEDCTMNYSPSFGRGIALEGTVNVTIKDCNVYRNGGGWRLGIGTSDMFGETIAANSSITIKGTTVGGASGEGFTQAGIRLNGAGAGIQVTIGGSGAGDRNTISYNGRAGIRLVNIEQVSIENNDISNNSYAGIRIDNTSQLSIDGNDISNNSYAGMRLEGIGQLSIDNNDISNNLRTGILLLDANTVSPHIRNNDIHNHVGEAGINIGGASNVTIGDNNNIYSNKAGIAFYVSNNTNIDGGTKTKSSQPVTITGNNIFSNTYAGIAIRDGISGALTITQNNIYSNTRGGIRMQRKCTLNISRNTIRDNLRGGIHTGSDVVDGGGFAPAQIGLGLLTIEKNKIHDNGQANMGGGIDVRHMPGTIYNNLVYGNRRGGIRVGDFITEIVNNTVVNNGWKGSGGGGGGIIYDDLAGAINDPPNGMLTGLPLIRNNISVYSKKAGLRVGGNGYDCPENPVYDAYGNYRDYNLLYANYPLNDIFNRDNAPDCGWPDLDDMSCIKQQYGGCGPYFVNGVGILLDALNDIVADPLFKAPDNYGLQRVSEGDAYDSPAINAGDDGTDMGCYGGSEPLDW